MNISQLLEMAVQKLSPVDAARLEAEILLCHALDVRRSFVYANPNLDVPLKRRTEFLRLVRQRREGQPIAYLTGHRAFWSLDLLVTPAVLIPRPETELLVECALDLIPQDLATLGKPFRIADLGTGSGAIALSIARERPGSEVHATDCSLEALQVAQENARRNGLLHVQFHHGSWAEPLHGQFDLILSNPPYVAESDEHLLKGDCRFEPRTALSPGADALIALRQVTVAASDELAPGGWLLVEHGHEQGEAVRCCLKSAGFADIKTRRDLAGIERVCMGRNPAALIS